MYFTIVMIIIGTSCPLYYKMLDIARTNTVTEYHSSLKHQTDNFDKILNDIYNVATILNRDNQLSEIKLFKGNDIPTPFHIKMNNISNIFKNLLLPVDIIDEAFILFSNSNILITTTRSFLDKTDYFKTFMQYDDISCDEILNLAHSDKYQKWFIMTKPITLFNTGTKERLTFLTRLSTQSTHFNTAIMCSVISKQKILNIFNIDKLPLEAFIYITDNDGNIILKHNYPDNLALSLKQSIIEKTINNKVYTAISETSKNVKCNVVLGIPNSYFHDTLIPIKQLIYRYIFTAILFGIIISVFFTIKSYAPIKGLLKWILDLTPYKDYKKNEFECIKEAFDKINLSKANLLCEVKSMEDILKNNLFSRLLRGNIHIKDERDITLRYIPQVEGSYRVAAINTRFNIYKNNDTSYTVSMLNVMIYNHLKESLYDDFVISPIDASLIVVLIPESYKDQKHNLFISTINEINKKMYQLHRVKVIVGISDLSTGIDHIPTAFNKARFCLMLTDPQSDIVVTNFKRSNESDNSHLIDINKMQKIYELILIGESITINSLLDEIVDCLRQNEIYSQQIIMQTFFVVRFIIESAINEHDFDIESFSIPKYNDTTADNLFMKLKETCEDVCSRITSKYHSRNIVLKENIISYINKNYCNPNIYAPLIADKFNISEKYLYKLIKEHTGKSLSSYIESLRMEKVIDMLKDIDIPIVNISSSCGFNSANSFYKAFKRCYSVSPSSYRKNFQV